MSRWITDDFQGNGTILCNTVMADGHHYTFVETHRMYQERTLIEATDFDNDVSDASVQVHRL